MLSVIRYCSLIVVCILVSACTGEKEPTHAVNTASVELPGAANVLVTVNGATITKYDLDQKLNDLLGGSQASLLNEQGRGKALQSMVMSRVIAQAADKQLTAEERKILDKRLESHRESLLVNYYLKNHSDLQPVTNEMVKAYYDKHPEKYGAKKLRIYEMLFSDRKTDMATREQSVTALKKVASQADWQSAAQQVKQQGFDVKYRKGNAGEAILDNQLKTLISNTKAGETSPLTFHKGKPYIVRVVAEQQQPAKPLQEVSLEIKKALTPVQMKKAINQVSEQLMKTATIEYKK